MKIDSKFIQFLPNLPYIFVLCPPLALLLLIVTFADCRDPGVVILQDESLRGQYGPPEPMVKILKRPSRPCDSSQVNGDSRPRQFKTLQQVTIAFLLHNMC